MNILVGDDHGLIRTGIKLICKDLDFVTIVAEAANGNEVLQAMKEHPEINLAILDINMPIKNGFECASIIKTEYPHCKILFLSMYEEEEYVVKAMELGAVGYVAKGNADNEIREALRNISEGGAYISQRLSRHLIKGFTKAQETEHLSSREKEVLKYICQGYALTEIGEKLNLSVKTIDTYKTRIMNKLGVEKKHELIALAREKGLVDFL